MDDSPSPMPLPRASKTWEDNAGVSMLDRGKAVAGMKRGLAEDTMGPTAKRARADLRRPDLEAADNLAGLVDSTWDEVVRAREAVSTAEE